MEPNPLTPDPQVDWTPETDSDLPSDTSRAPGSLRQARRAVADPAPGPSPSTSTGPGWQGANPTSATPKLLAELKARAGTERTCVVQVGETFEFVAEKDRKKVASAVQVGYLSLDSTGGALTVLANGRFDHASQGRLRKLLVGKTGLGNVNFASHEMASDQRHRDERSSADKPKKDKKQNKAGAVPEDLAVACTTHAVQTIITFEHGTIELYYFPGPPVAFLAQHVDRRLDAMMKPYLTGKSRIGYRFTLVAPRKWQENADAPALTKDPTTRQNFQKLFHKAHATCTFVT